MGRIVLGLASALLLASLPAQAVTINFQQGGNALVSFNKAAMTFTANPNVKIFENFDSIGKGYTSTVGSDGVLKAPTTNLVAGSNATVNGRIFNTNISGTAARPFVTTVANGGLPLSTGNYGAVGSGGQFFINFYDYFGKPLHVFSFALGSVDGGGLGSSQTGNKVVLHYIDGTTETFIGAQLTSGGADGNQSAAATNGRVTFDTRGVVGKTMRGAVFSSTVNAFEFDDFAGAAPEPATWGMMIMGFGLAGFSLRRGRRPVAA
jgi:hypothetical protein